MRQICENYNIKKSFTDCRKLEKLCSPHVYACAFLQARRILFFSLNNLSTIPYVADSKRAMDEYTSEIFMGGKNTIVMHNTCEDSLLATPLIYDLVILGELFIFEKFGYPCFQITYRSNI